MNKILLLLVIPFFTFAQPWDFVGNYDSDGRHHPVTFSNDNFGFVLAGQNNAGEYIVALRNGGYVVCIDSQTWGPTTTGGNFAIMKLGSDCVEK